MIENTSSFDEIRAQNVSRALKWHNGNLLDWSPLEWAGAMCGEAGEAANVAKKLKRLDTKIIGGLDESDKSRLIQKLADEIADVFLYLDLLAACYDIDMELAIRKKFNEVSDRHEFSERL